MFKKVVLVMYKPETKTYYRINLVNILCENSGYFEANRLIVMRSEISQIKLASKVWYNIPTSIYYNKISRKDDGIIRKVGKYFV